MLDWQHEQAWIFKDSWGSWMNELQRLAKCKWGSTQSSALSQTRVTRRAYFMNRRTALRTDVFVCVCECQNGFGFSFIKLVILFERFAIVEWNAEQRKYFQYIRHRSALRAATLPTYEQFYGAIRNTARLFTLAFNNKWRFYAPTREYKQYQQL